MNLHEYMLTLLMLAGLSCQPAAPRAPTPTGRPEPAALRDEGKIDEHRRVPMSDGVGIDVWIVRGKASTTAPAASRPAPPGTVVVLHGMMESKKHYLWLPQRLVPLGYDVVLMDLRAHGASGGARSTFGALEKHDVKAVVNAVLTAGLHLPVYVWGISMGAATAIQYASIDPRCRGVVAVTAYRDFPSVAARLLPGVGGLVPVMANFDPKETSTIVAARKLTAPLIVVHGRDDSVIPWEHARDIYEAAAGPKRLFLLDGAGHTTILSDRDDWMVDRVVELTTMSPAPAGKSETNPRPQ
jgi:alpha-beta hydrolase superfamily lysophospholipase